MVNISFTYFLILEYPFLPFSWELGAKENQSKYTRGLAVSNPITPEEGGAYSLTPLKGSYASINKSILPLFF